MRAHARETTAFESGEQREARLEQARLHDRETRVSEGGEQREAETDCSTSCYLGPWTNKDINICQTVQVTVQATSNPAIFVQSLMCRVTYICTFFPFLVDTIVLIIKIDCLLKLTPTCCMHLTSLS